MFKIFYKLYLMEAGRVTWYYQIKRKWWRLQGHPKNGNSKKKILQQYTNLTGGSQILIIE